MSAATLKPIRLECYLPRQSGANKVSLFRADSLTRYLQQCALDSSVVAVDKTVVGLNVATRSLVGSGATGSVVNPPRRIRPSVRTAEVVADTEQRC